MFGEDRPMADASGSRWSITVPQLRGLCYVVPFHYGPQAEIWLGKLGLQPNSLELEHASGNMYLCDLSHVFGMLYVIIVCWSWTCQTQ